ncbi:MAG: hypothetical protein Q8Q09_05600 [Deltaproteobacteria bacterium]|nr:hypothetical protein [Deltaproteobacteria bacterium]
MALWGKSLLIAMSELLEFFTLTHATRTAIALGEEAPLARRRVRLAAEQMHAAETLFAQAQRAQAQRALCEASSTLERIRVEFPSIAQRLEPEVGEDAATQVPVEVSLDEEWTEAHSLHFERRLREIRSTLGALGALGLTPQERTFARTRRLSVLAIVIVVGTAIAWRQWHVVELTAQASSAFDATRGATNATDGYPSTNWLLPDGQQGWLDLRFNRRRVSKLTLYNVQGLVHYGSILLTIEMYSGARLVRSMEHSMQATVATSLASTVALAAREPIDRIRINVRTFHELGGGLGEVRVE